MITSTEGRWAAVARKKWARAAVRMAVALLPALLPAGVALAQTPPFEEAKTLSSVVDPIEKNFDIAQSGAGKYRITLTDLGARIVTDSTASPLKTARLAGLQLVVTRGQQVVTKLNAEPADTQGQAQPPAQGQTQNLAPDGATDTYTVDFDATPGTYTVHVVGKPSDQLGSGPVGVNIANIATTTSVLDFSGVLAPLSQKSTTLNTYQIELDVPADDTYEMTLADLGFPATGGISVASAYMFKSGGSSLAACLNVPAIEPTCPSTKEVTLTEGHYQFVAGAELVDTTSSGLISVYVKSKTTGTVLHARTVELGAVKRISPASFQLNAGSYTLSINDLKFPADLLEGAALVTSAAQVTATVDLETLNKPFTVAADGTAYDVFTYAKADNTPADQSKSKPAGPGAGAFDVEVKPASGASALSYIDAMGDPSGSPSTYLFPVDIATVGTYRLKFGDFQFPAAVSGVRLAIVQGGAIAGKTDPGSALTLDAPLTAGRATVIVILKPSTTGTSLEQAGGTFGLEMALTSGGANVLDATQGIGGLVSVSKLSITTAGNYDITVKDLDAPEAFNDLMVVISRGSQKLGVLIVGSGGNNPQGGNATLPDRSLDTGNYSITLIARPGDAVGAATYGLSIAASPPAPTVTLTAAQANVALNTPAGLTWTSTGATSCTASSNPSGLWGGTKATSGTDATGNLTGSTTFTLKCTDGNGRSAEKSVTVGIAAQGDNGGGGKGGGGGAFDWLTLAALALGGAVHFGARARRRGSLAAQG